MNKTKAILRMIGNYNVKVKLTKITVTRDIISIWSNTLDHGKTIEYQYTVKIDEPNGDPNNIMRSSSWTAIQKRIRKQTKRIEGRGLSLIDVTYVNCNPETGETSAFTQVINL